MQLSTIENITEDNIVFHNAKKQKLRNSKIKYERIKIERKLPNGKFSPLVFDTPFLFSFGISERRNEDTGKLTQVIQFQFVFGKRIKNQIKKTKTFSIF